MRKSNSAFRISGLFSLIRLPLSLMVTFSALTGYLLTGRELGLSFVYLFSGLFLLSAGASVLNQVQEYKLDALMPRTRRRPLPAGEITPGAATGMALFFILTGSLLLSLNGWIPMFLGLLNILFYNLIYTPLKRQSWLAIVPGAVVGGVPPLIGWGSAGAYIFHPKAMFLFIFVSLWQVPHFWLLMIKYGKEYEKAGFQTISRILNEKQIKTVVFCWGILTSLFLMFFPIFGFYLKPVLLGSLTLTNLFFIGMFYRYLFLQKNAKTIGKAFVLINTYAVAIFVLLIVNSLIS